jgi:hypothetical protein
MVSARYGSEIPICDETNFKPSADLRVATEMPVVLDLFSLASIGLINNNKSHSPQEFSGAGGDLTGWGEGRIVYHR